MAYAAVVQWRYLRRHAGGRRIALKVTETEAAVDDAWCTANDAIAGVTVTRMDGTVGNAEDVPMFPVFAVRYLKAELTEDGTEIRPMLGTPAVPGAFTTETFDSVFEIDAPRVFQAESGAFMAAFPPSTDPLVLSGMSLTDSEGGATINTLIVLDEVP